MSTTRKNHYVPIWYQKRFLLTPHSKLCCLDLCPNTIDLPNGNSVVMNNIHWWTPQQCFWEYDLYSTFFFDFVSDEIEKYLFGRIDNDGLSAIRAFTDNDIAKQHQYYSKFFEYLDAQKIRTPKGLDWIKTKYSELNRLQLMMEMQQIRQMHCTIWMEAVREIVSAEDSDIKFVITDHPITIYNPACPPNSTYCQYPNDPSIAFKGSQTVFPLDLNQCLILTNLEYAQNSELEDLLVKRIHARHFGQTYSRTDVMIRSRRLSEKDVVSVNYILKARASKYIAAAKKEWLFPENDIKADWSQLGKVLLPPSNELFQFGGEMYVGFKDGTSHYQDAFGRTEKELPYLKKPSRKGKIKPNEPCICGSGKKYKKCCRGKDPADIPSTTELSIRERNLMFFEMISNILGLDPNKKTWTDVRRELSDQQVRDIHSAYECLWPKDTNVIDLLPRPDQKVFRALYSGLIDPRLIAKSVISYSVYFDEILVVNPFINPANIKPEFSPVNSPSQYKQETLKNVLLFVELIPFVELGVVNLIPDPCSLNLHLQKQIFDMAKSRLKGFNKDSEHLEPMMKLMKDEIFRNIAGLDDEKLKTMIKAALPDLTNKEKDDVLKHMKQKQLEDPLALLQPMVSENGKGQVITTRLMPNFELGFFLAQLTGSFIYTDNQHRWLEITNIQNQTDKVNKSLWETLEINLRKLDFIHEINPMINLDMRKAGKLGLIRGVLRKIFMAVQNEKDPSRTLTLNLTLSEELKKAHRKSETEWKTNKKIAESSEEDTMSLRFTCKMDWSIPSNGFQVNSVQRLLLSHGNINYLNAVPMAMFARYND